MPQYASECRKKMSRRLAGWQGESSTGILLGEWLGWGKDRAGVPAGIFMALSRDIVGCFRRWTGMLPKDSQCGLFGTSC